MLSIGEFSKITGLTIKTIRLYHQKKILFPAKVDGWTGYRYYNQQSIDRARIIKQLRGFDFSLTEIREILSHYCNETDILDYLELQQSVIEEKLQKYKNIRTALQAKKEAIMANTKFKLDRNIDERLESWLKQVTAETEEDSLDEVPNFAISSLYGEAGGEALAAVLGKRVGFHVWDTEMIEKISSNEKHVSPILGTLNEKQRNQVEEILRSKMTSEAYAEQGDWLKQLRMVAALAMHGRFIFVEMGANFLLKAPNPGQPTKVTKEQALRIRLNGYHEILVQHYSAKNKLDIDRARKEVELKEKEINNFISFNFDRDIENSAEYDMVLNPTTMILFDAIDLIVKAFEAIFRPNTGWWY